MRERERKRRVEGCLVVCCSGGGCERERSRRTTDDVDMIRACTPGAHTSVQRRHRPNQTHTQVRTHLADVVAVEAAGGGEDDEVGEGVADVHLPLVAPRGKEVLGLLFWWVF